MSEPTTYQQRMTAELEELNTRLTKLSVFIDTPAFLALPSIERGDLRVQHFAMHEYSIALTRRVARTDGQVTSVATTFDFGAALKRLKGGQRVARVGWNGKGMFVYLVPAASYPAQTGAAKAHFGNGAMVPYGAYLALKGVNETVNTWVPSITDCLADDWMAVEA